MQRGNTGKSNLPGMALRLFRRASSWRFIRSAAFAYDESRPLARKNLLTAILVSCFQPRASASGESNRHKVLAKNREM